MAFSCLFIRNEMEMDVRRSMEKQCLDEMDDLQAVVRAADKHHDVHPLRSRAQRCRRKPIMTCTVGVFLDPQSVLAGIIHA